MAGKELTEEQKIKIDKIKEEWWEEVQPYLQKPSPRPYIQLDGEDDIALAKLQQKYVAKMQAVVNEKQ